jgi:hypothetical protein
LLRRLVSFLFSLSCFFLNFFNFISSYFVFLLFFL